MPRVPRQIRRRHPHRLLRPVVASRTHRHARQCRTCDRPRPGRRRAPSDTPVLEEAPLVSALELWLPGRSSRIRKSSGRAGPGPCQCVVGWPAKCRAAALTATRRAQHSWVMATKCQTHHRTLPGSTTATLSTCAPGPRPSPVRAVSVRGAASSPPSKRTTGPSSTRLRTPRRPTT